MRRTTPFLVVLAVLASGSIAAAAPVLPLWYDTLNGHTGSYNYWDESYNGTGNTAADGAPLTGGLGDLTDGIIATTNWFDAEAPAGNGPYVGWDGIDPTITFYFTGGTTIDSLTIHVDDSNGAGGVSTPRAIRINGTTYSLTDDPGGAPVAFTFSQLAATGPLELQLLRDDENGHSWVFLSEVTFQSASVPEPGGLLLLGVGLLATHWIVGRVRRA